MYHILVLKILGDWPVTLLEYRGAGRSDSCDVAGRAQFEKVRCYMRHLLGK